MKCKRCNQPLNKKEYKIGANVCLGCMENKDLFRATYTILEEQTAPIPFDEDEYTFKKVPKKIHEIIKKIDRDMFEFTKEEKQLMRKIFIDKINDL